MKKTGKLALGGILTGLALVLLALTVMPVTTVGLVALASLCSIPLTIELGRKAGLLHYGAVSLLALLLIPTPEGKLLYAGFLGYYPVFKAWLEQKNLSRLVETAIKIGLLLLTVGGGGWLGLTLLSLPLPGWVTWWMVPLGAVILTALFIIYDGCLTGLVSLYLTRLRPVVRRVFHLQ